MGNYQGNNFFNKISNFLGNFKDKFNIKLSLGILGIIILLVALPAGLYLVQQTQIFKPKAAAPKDQIDLLTAQLLEADQKYDALVSQSSFIPQIASPSPTSLATPSATPAVIFSPQTVPTPSATSSATPQATSSAVYAETTSYETQQQLDSMKGIAIRRKDLLLQKIRENPQEFLNKATLADKISQFPEEIRPYIEQRVSIEGMLTIFHGDDFENKKSINLYNLKVEQGQVKNYVLYFPKDPPTVSSGSKINVVGVALDPEVAVEEVKEVQSSGQVLQATIANANVAVILARFSNTTSEPFPASNASSDMFTASDSVKKFYEEISFGKLSFNGQVFGWYVLPRTVSSSDPCDFEGWMDLANQQAVAAGVNFSNFNIRYYVFGGTRPISCPGGSANDILRRAWSIGQSNRKGVYAHELGHVLSVDHANVLDCGSKSIDVPAQCRNIEYGDVTDVMGFTTDALTPFNGPHKIKAGWANSQTVSSSGTYAITPLEVQSSNPQVLQFQKPDTGDYYLISYRQRTGFGRNISGLKNTEGVSIHVSKTSINPFRTTQLLDMTPNSNTGLFEYFDAVLSDGATFVDPINNISIKQISHTLSTDTNPGSVTVEVNFPPVSESRRVFVTSTTYNGDLKTAGSNVGLSNVISGLDGADKICQSRANVAGLGGVWKTWLSDSSTSAASRLNHSSVPYKRLDGVTVANNWTDLTDGTLINPISIDENVNIREWNVWTNTKTNGEIYDVRYSCNNWTNATNTYFGGTGGSGTGSSFWTESGGASGCSNSVIRLYCFEEPTPSPTPTPTPTPSPTPSPCTPCSADLSKDGLVTGLDYSIAVTCFDRGINGKDGTGRSCTVADINKDGKIDNSDVNCVKDQFGKSCTTPTPTPSPTPSPSPTPAPCGLCSGDLSGDGIVTGLDYSIAVTCFDRGINGKDNVGRSCSIADINKDGIIDDKDIACVRQGFNTCNGILTPTPTPTASPKPASSYSLSCIGIGDVNEDGSITSTDSLRVLRIVVRRVTPTVEQRRRADTNGDGQITVTDALQIQRYVAGLIKTFPVCNKP